MPFIPHTEGEVRAMLGAIGETRIDALFDEIDPALTQASFKDIPAGATEMALLADFAARAKRDEAGPCFLGAGCYDHHIPAAVWDIASRGEFMTAYTPYQAEASQGTLQLVYEYQSMMTALADMDVTNASVYDGGTALGEAVLMAVRAARRGKRGAAENAPATIAVAGACHPLYVDAAANIVRHQDIRLVGTGFGADGRADLAALEALSPTAVVVQQPNFLGVLEPVDDIVRLARECGALVIGVVNPVALAWLKPPGSWGEDGADIACGDGQPLGIPMASGGPSFGFICTRRQLVRQLPGRIVGRTQDRHGEDAFTLTLQAREQHIRRGKATSNICTNQGLMVTAATIHMALLGAEGLRRVATQSHANTRALVEAATSLPGIRQRFDAPFCHEAVLDLGRPADAVVEAMAEQGVIAGLPLGGFDRELANCLLVCATEKRTEADIDAFRQALAACT